MEIRTVKFEELNSVLDLIDEYDRTISKRPSLESLKDIYDKLTNSGSCVIGAFENIKLVGTCTLNICQNLSWSGRPYAIIENVIVAKTHRRMGYGKSILKQAIILSKASGCYKVSLTTGSKRKEIFEFYEAAGFTGSKRGFQYRFNA